jgi:hypothetical protein
MNKGRRKASSEHTNQKQGLETLVVSVPPSDTCAGRRFRVSGLTSFLTMSFLESTFRDWKVRLEAMALRKPALQEKRVLHERSFLQSRNVIRLT